MAIVDRVIKRPGRREVGSMFTELLSKDDIRWILKLIQGSNTGKSLDVEKKQVEDLLETIWDRYLSVSFEHPHRV